MPFAEFWSSFTELFKLYVLVPLTQISFIDVIDILLLTLLLFYVFRFIRNRRAGKLAFGLLLIIIVLLLSNALHMKALSFILQNFYQVGIIAIIIVFQPELRAALEKVGNTPFLTGIKNITAGEKRYISMLTGTVESICDAAADMSRSKTGALIVIERATKLGEYIDTGIVVNAQVTSDLLKNIFFKNAPLHDGAVIIRDLRIYAAGCFLRTTERDDIDSDLGTRHRAAIGISEVSDAPVIVVSEETGMISLVYDGKITRGLNRTALKNELMKLMTPLAGQFKEKNAKEAGKK